MLSWYKDACKRLVEYGRKTGMFEPPADYKLDVPVAIGDQMNETAYKVSGIPQIQLIDRKGRIRLIMIGYDEANEPKLAAEIAKLLAEK